MQCFQFFHYGWNALREAGLKQDAENSFREVRNKRELVEKPRTQKQKQVNLLCHFWYFYPLFIAALTAQVCPEVWHSLFPSRTSCAFRFCPTRPAELSEDIFTFVLLMDRFQQIVNPIIDGDDEHTHCNLKFVWNARNLKCQDYLNCCSDTSFEMARMIEMW